MSDNDLHRLLARQLRKLSLDAAAAAPAANLGNAKWRELLSHIDQTYKQADQDRYILERSLMISSAEMQRLYNTQQRDVQSTLEQERRFLRAAINGITDNFTYKNADGVYQLCNRAFEKYIGLKEEDLIGSVVYDIFPERIARRIDHHDKAIMQSREPDIFEYDDAERGMVMETLKYPLLDAGGRVQGIIALSHNITQRKQDEAQIRLLARMFAKSGESIFVTDKNNRIVAVNDAFTRTFGYGEKEVLGKDPALLNAGRDDEHSETLWRTVRAEGEWQGQIWNKTKTGKLVPGLMTVSSVRDDDDRLANYIGIFTDITDIKRSQEKLDHLAHHDALTGLPNRLLFSERLRQAMRGARRDERLMALLFIDLDRFKNINDTLGHPAGDKMLRVVAERLLACVRESDTVARMGGDEYLILLPRVGGPEDADTVADNLLRKIALPMTIEAHEIVVTASVGISMYPRDAEDTTSLIKHADSALYRAKEEGRSGYQHYTTDMSTKAFEHFALETHLRRALEREEFVLVYQPQVSLDDLSVIGAEALVRWRHPELGLQPPAGFIDLAEEAGLIAEIGYWIFKQSCLQLKNWRAQGHGDLSLAVNVSVRQIQSPDLADSLRRIVDQAGVAARSLKLEITENSFMSQPQRAMRAIEALRDTGFRVSLDDFGTGYSSLRYLQQLTVDELKIDRSFIRAMQDNNNSRAIIRAILAMGESMDIHVIAEGVEHDEQIQFLRQSGCRYAQGFLFGGGEQAEMFGRHFIERAEGDTPARRAAGGA